MDPLQELCLACRLGNIDSVDGILCKHKGIDLNKPGKDGMAPLEEACSSGSLEVVKRLMAEGTVVSTDTMRGFQALHTAVYNKKQPVVEFLIREGKCSVDTPTSHQEVPLHLACLRGDVSMVTFLLGCNADCTCRDTNGNTSLHYAAAGNSADVVQCLVSRHGELKDIKNKFGQTAAHRAAMLGCYVALEALVLSRVDLLVKDNDGHTPHDLANLFQNAKCSSITKPGTVPLGAVIFSNASSNSLLTVQTVPFGRSSSGSEGDRISGECSPKPGAMKRRPSLTGISRPRTMTLPVGLGLSKKPVYVSGELAETVSRSGSIDWQNVCIEPPPDIHFIHPKHHTTLKQSNRQLVSIEHGIRLKIGSSYWKPPREGAEVEVWLCAGIQSSYMCPRGHFVVSPICFVSCKTIGPCHITLTLPSAVRIEQKDTHLLTILSAVPSNASIKLESPQSVGAGTLTPLAGSSPQPLSNGSVRFTCQLTSASLFAVAVCMEEFPSPSHPLKCCLTVGYEVQSDQFHVKGFDLMAYVGMRLPSITAAIRADMESAGSMQEEKLFDLKTKSILLDVGVNRPLEWELTARDSGEINYTNLCICHDMDEGFSFTRMYPPHQRFFLDPRLPRASLTCAVRIVSVAGKEELCKAVVTPYNPLRETTPDPSNTLPNVSCSLPNPVSAMVGSPPSHLPLFRISSEQGTSLLAVPTSSSQHTEQRRGSLSPSSSHSSFGNREASPAEEGSKLLESIGSDGITRLSTPCHVSTRETSPNDSDVSRQSDAPLIKPRVTNV